MAAVAALALAALLSPSSAMAQDTTRAMTGTIGIPGSIKAEHAELLRAELPAMLAEHVKIGAALDRMARVARANGATDVAALADAIRLHARTEEEVLYPAAVLVGDMARGRLSR